VELEKSNRLFKRNFCYGEISLFQTQAEKARMSRLKEELEKLWEISLKDKNILVFSITNTIKRHLVLLAVKLTSFK
jgi:hypothetical protein